MRRCCRPTGAWVYVSVAPALAFIAANVDRNYQTDLWHHLARGREIVERGALLNHDVFSYTVTHQPLQDPNWLTQVGFFLLYRLGGLPFLQVVNAALLAGAVALLVRHCRRAGGSLRLACALGVFSFLGLWQLFLIRPQTLSFVLFAILYLILDAARTRRGLLFLPPLLMALWVNLHGAFPIGLVLIGVFLGAQFVESVWQLRRRVLRDPATWCLALCLAGSILATLLSPYGWGLYQYVGTTSTRAAERQIEEWLTPNPHLFIGKVWVGSLVLMLAAFALPGRRPTLREVCLAACFLPLSASAVRMVAWWLFIAAPIVAAQLAAGLPRSAVEDTEADYSPTVGDGAIWILLVLSMVLSLPGLESYNPLLRLSGRGQRLENDLQAVVTRFEKTPGRVFARLEWGEYLSWTLYPHYTVFMDGRIEIYPDAVWEEYEAVNYARADWQEILDHYAVTHLLLDRRRHHALIAQVTESPRWQRTAESGPAVLYVRRQPAPASAIRPGSVGDG